MLRVVSLLFAVLSLAGSSGAASLLSSSHVCYSNGVAQACSDIPPEFGAGATTQALYTAPVSGGSLQASAGMTVADYGLLGARARASIDFVEPAGAPFVFHGVTGRAYAETVDTLTASGAAGAGAVRMRWSITGGNDLGYVGSDSVDIPGVTVNLRLDCFAQIGASFVLCPDAAFAWSTSGGVSELVTIDVPIEFGVPTVVTYQVTLSATTSVRFDGCLDCAAAFSGRSDADFGSTLRLVGVELLDSGGNPLDASGIASESGFAYHEVPETSLAPLAALATLAGLAARSRARRAPRARAPQSASFSSRPASVPAAPAARSVAG